MVKWEIVIKEHARVLFSSERTCGKDWVRIDNDVNAANRTHVRGRCGTPKITSIEPIQNSTLIYQIKAKSLLLHNSALYSFISFLSPCKK